MSTFARVVLYIHTMLACGRPGVNAASASRQTKLLWSLIAEGRHVLLQVHDHDMLQVQGMQDPTGQTMTVQVQHPQNGEKFATGICICRVQNGSIESSSHVRQPLGCCGQWPHSLMQCSLLSTVGVVLQAILNTVLVIALVAATSVVLFGINYGLAELSKISYRQ